MTDNYLVIMAGGIGSRFWPMSTPSRPKQFLDVTGTGRTLFQSTVNRFKDLCPPENILVVTSAQYKHYINDQCPELPDNNILLEPERKNTAPCIAYAVFKILARNEDANIIVAPSDHLITNENEFIDVVTKGLSFVKDNDALLTLGILPHRPETGYGYIQSGEEASGDIKKVKAFKEKPNVQTAKTYLESGGYFWNSGIFLWSLQSILSAFRQYQPEIYDLFDKDKEYFNKPEEQDVIDKLYPNCPEISIDYGIMENAKNIHVLPCDFGWSDLGTWGSLWEKTSHDKSENSLMASTANLYETDNCIIKVSGDKKVVIQGLSDYIVVDSESHLLICKKNEEQRIKEFSKSIEKQ